MKTSKLISIFVIALAILFVGSWLLNEVIETLPAALDAETITAQEWQDTISQWK